MTSMMDSTTTDRPLATVVGGHSTLSSRAADGITLARSFLTVLLVSARYGGRDAHLGVEDLARMTGLATRTVKAALAACGPAA